MFLMMLLVVSLVIILIMITDVSQANTLHDANENLGTSWRWSWFLDLFQVSSNISLLKLPRWVELSTWGNFFTFSCIIRCWNCNFKICICPWLSIRGPGQMLCKQRTKVWLEGGEGSGGSWRGFELVTFWEWGSCGEERGCRQWLMIPPCVYSTEYSRHQMYLCQR